MSELIQILYVDSNPSDRKKVRRALQTQPGVFNIITATTPRAFQKKVARPDYSLILADLEAFGEKGIQLLKAIQSLQPELPVVILTGNSSVQLAVDAIKNGAADYLLKMPADIEKLSQILQSLNRQSQEAKASVISKVHDILHHKQIDDQSSQTERKYHRLVEQIKAVIYTSASSGISSPLYMSPQVKDLFGYSVDEWVSEPGFWLKLINPDDRKTVLAEFNRANQTREPLSIEYRMIAQDGRVVWIHDDSQPFKDETGLTQYWNGFIYDITDRKQSEEALNRRAKELQALYETSLEINTQNNLNNLLQSIVARAATLLGAQMGGLYLVGRDGESLELVISYNLPVDYVGTILHAGEGISGRILQTGQPLMIDDHSRWAGRAKPYNHTSFKRVLGLPLKIGERIIGVINVVDNIRAGSFNEDEIRLVSLFADQAAIVIENTRLYEASQREIKDRIQAEQALQEIQIQLANRIGELEQRSQEITHLTQLSNLLQLSLQPNEAYSIISQYATQLFPNSAGALFTLNESQQDLVPRTKWGQPPPRVSPLRHEDCWALRRNRPYLATDTSNGMLCRHISEPLPGSYLCIPILSEGKEIGLLYLQMDQDQQALTAEHQQLAAAVAEQAGLVLSNLHLRENLRAQAISDPLTGLFNHYYMQEYLDKKIHQSKQEGKPVNVILIDLDNFKVMNDKFGYSTGDDLLQKFGRMVKQTAEKTGIACRHIGDALTMILPDITLQESIRKSEILRQEIKKLMVPYEDHYLQNLTVSIGIACFPEHGQSVSELLKAAYTAALHAKEQGGDRVVIADPSHEGTASTQPE